MLIYFSVVLMALLGLCGLAIDSGRIELRTAQLQAAADNGALVAAAEFSIANGAWQTAAANEVTSFATANGLVGLTTSARQKANAGPYSLDYSALEVTVSQTLPLTFMSLLTHTATSTVTARAVGMVPPCSYFMNAVGFSISLASTGFNSGCPVYNNGNISVDYFATYNTGQTKVVGPSAASILSPHVNPAPVFNAPVLPDPLAYVIAPSFTSCNATVTSSTLSPGTYCGRLTLQNGSYTLSPGLYIVTGGVLVHNATVTGSGVTIYCTQGGGSGFGIFRIEAGSTWHVNASVDNSAGIAGVVIMGDRAWVGGIRDFSVDSSTYQGDGIVYTTNTGLTVSQANMYGYNYFGIVTNLMYEYGSNLGISNNYSSLPGGNPFHIPARLVQ